MTNLMAERDAFEKEISGPPYEKSVLRYPNNHERCAWPGNYRDINVDLAWNIWQARAALLEAEPAAAEGQAGWRWVPVEPTEAMVKAMAEAWQKAVAADDPNECIAEYRAALAVAPRAQPSPEEQT